MAEVEILAAQEPKPTGERYLFVRVSFLDYSFDQNVVLTTTDVMPSLVIYADEYELNYLRDLPTS